ncbi:MAG: cyclic pyranopterin monophosphate synthase MoaC [bacterium]|nr:cyclic pyranopterin monophosphate synthase MoaC [bacterium]
MNELTHVDRDGNARMVDVSAKPPLKRTARAEGSITLAPETLRLIAENQIKKGDVLTVAELAGVQAAKRTFELIPLCHVIELTEVRVVASLGDDGVRVEARASCVGRTGVEMEALTAVSAALLTVYDMCKAVDKTMSIGGIRLIEKIKQEIGAD